MENAVYANREGHWVKAILTDQVRPLDAMRTLQGRFPHAVALEHRPAIQMDVGDTSYAERIRAATSDPEIIAGFLSFVRNGVGPTDFETALLAELLTEQSARAANS
jgi:exonuclease SbcD